MQQVQVQVVQPEPAQARIKRAEGRLVTVMADPQLGGDEKIGAIDPAAHDALADLPLVEIGYWGVTEQKIRLRATKAQNRTKNTPFQRILG